MFLISNLQTPIIAHPHTRTLYMYIPVCVCVANTADIPPSSQSKLITMTGCYAGQQSQPKVFLNSILWLTFLQHITFKQLDGGVYILCLTMCEHQTLAFFISDFVYQRLFLSILDLCERMHTWHHIDFDVYHNISAVICYWVTLAHWDASFMSTKTAIGKVKCPIRVKGKGEMVCKTHMKCKANCGRPSSLVHTSRWNTSLASILEVCTLTSCREIGNIMLSIS